MATVGVKELILTSSHWVSS